MGEKRGEADERPTSLGFVGSPFLPVDRDGTRHWGRRTQFRDCERSTDAAQIDSEMTVVLLRCISPDDGSAMLSSQLSDAFLTSCVCTFHRQIHPCYFNRQAAALSVLCALLCLFHPCLAFASACRLCWWALPRELSALAWLRATHGLPAPRWESRFAPGDWATPCRR